MTTSELMHQADAIFRRVVALAYGNTCRWCGKPGTESNPIVGHHNIPRDHKRYRYRLMNILPVHFTGCHEQIHGAPAAYLVWLEANANAWWQFYMKHKDEPRRTVLPYEWEEWVRELQDSERELRESVLPRGDRRF